jgi:hypothetical protein
MTDEKAKTWKTDHAIDATNDAATAWIDKHGHTFPDDALSPRAQAAAATIADVYRIPIEMPALCALATISGAMGRSWAFEGGAKDGQTTHGNLYVLIGAPAGSGKAAPAAILTKPFLEYASQVIKRFQDFERPLLQTEIECAMTEKRATLRKFNVQKAENGGRSISESESELTTLNKRIAEATRRLTPPAPYVEDVTSQKLVLTCARNVDGATFVFSAEGAEVLRIAGGRYRGDGKADLEVWLKGFSCEILRQDRVGRESVEAHPCLSSLLLVQPSVISETYGSPEAMRRGFCARFIAVSCDLPILDDDGEDRTLDRDALEAWNRLIADICDRRPSNPGTLPHLVRFNDGAREVFRLFENEIAALRRKIHDVHEQLARWRELAIRIAAVLAVADDPDTPLDIVGADVAERAVRISRWAVAAQLAILREGRHERMMERARKLGTLIDHNHGLLSLRDAEKSHGFRSDEIYTLAAFAPRDLTITEIQNPNGGRPSMSVMRPA